MEWDKRNKQTKQKQTHRYRKQTDSFKRGGSEGAGEIGEGIKQNKTKNSQTQTTEGKGGINGDRRLSFGFGANNTIYR